MPPAHPAPALHPAPAGRLLLDTLLASMRDGVVVENAQGVVVRANATAAALLGVEGGVATLEGTETAAATAPCWGRCVDPEGEAQRHRALAATGAAVTRDRLAMADGRLLERDLVPIPEADGSPGGLLWQLRDVTPPRGAVANPADAEALRQFYERVLEALPAQVAVFDGRTLAYRYVTPSAIRDPHLRAWIVGRTDLEYAAYRGWSPEVGTRRQERVLQAVRTRQAASWEESLPTPSGELRHFARFVTPVLDVDGVTELVVGYGIEITERRLMEDHLVEATRVAEASARAKEDFLANMSHEIRTPLNALVGTTHLLESTAVDEQQRRYLGAIRYSTDTLLALINDILDLTKVGNGAVEFETAPYDLRELAQGVVESLRASAAQKGIGFGVTVAPDVPQVVLGDARRLTQVLLNLLGNAIKFTATGHVALAVTATPPNGDSGWLTFRVEDTGIGIPADKHDVIFNAFAQARSDTSRRFGGTGLGLTIVRELVTRQGGRITLDSVEGKGSVFVVHLPVRLPVGAVTPERAAPTAPVGDAPTTVAGARLLLVEDNPLNQLVGGEILVRAGAEVVMAGNGREAVDRLRADPDFDLVLMDIQMPEMDGFEATRVIREALGLDASRLPIMALTANALVEQQARALAAGMNDFITKPFDPVLLVRRVAAAMRRPADTRGCAAAPAVAAAVSSTAATTAATAAAPDPAGKPPAVDMAALEAVTMGDPEILGDLVDAFVQHAPVQLAALRDAAHAGDRERTAFTAHALRGSAGAVGARPLMSLLHAVEQAARSLPRPSGAEAMPTALDAVGDEFARVLGTLQDALERARRDAPHPPTTTCAS